jgi:signal transduction histidine kinase
LRWRLAAWFTLVMLLCTGIVFFAVYHGTGTEVRRQIDRELAGEAAEFAHNLRTAGPDNPRQLVQAARRYLRTQPFSVSSTLLFAVVPGAGTATNSQELVTVRSPDDGETATAQRAENRLALQLIRAPSGYQTIEAPRAENLRLLKRPVRLLGGMNVTIGAGEALTDVTRAQHSVAQTFILAGLLALAAVLVASYLVGARDAAAAQDGERGRPRRRRRSAPRIERRPGEAEIRVLSDAFNNILDRLTEAFAGQREFIADASHELRTPLTVIPRPA